MFSQSTSSVRAACTLWPSVPAIMKSVYSLTMQKNSNEASHEVLFNKQIKRKMTATQRNNKEIIQGGCTPRKRRFQKCSHNWATTKIKHRSPCWGSIMSNMSATLNSEREQEKSSDQSNSSSFCRPQWMPKLAKDENRKKALKREGEIGRKEKKKRTITLFQLRF